MDPLPIALRPATQEDTGYLYKTWLIDFHKTYPANFIPSSIYVPHQTGIIDTIISNSTISVACIDDEPNTIVGYLVYQIMDENNIIIHWAQTKGIFRRMGVMNTLLNDLQAKNKNLICTHIFNLYKEFKDKYHLIYDPTLLKAS